MIIILLLYYFKTAWRAPLIATTVYKCLSTHRRDGDRRYYYNNIIIVLFAGSNATLVAFSVDDTAITILSIYSSDIRKRLFFRIGTDAIIRPTSDSETAMAAVDQQDRKKGKNA